MKNNSKRQMFVRELPKILLILGLLASFFAPAYTAVAQTPAIQTDGILAPLSPDLKWGDLGRAERTLFVNGQEVTLSGNAYNALEEFNLDGREDIANYYATPDMAKRGWTLVSSLPSEKGVTSVYFNESGIFASVEIVGCKDNEALACMTVWASDHTDLVPSSKPEAAPNALGTVGKTYPANNAIFVSTKPTLIWGAYTGSDLNHYRYCVDKINNNACDSKGGWTSVWYKTYVTVTLNANDVEYWQVEAVLNDNTKVAADSGTWWVFTTGTVIATATPKVTLTPTQPPSPPIVFNKILPANGAVSQSATPVLSWGTSTYATAYSYCIDTVDNNLCDTNWVSTGASTFVALTSGVASNTQYFWQARATNAQGTVEGNGSGAWWHFTTASSGPTNDTVGSAEQLTTVPYQDTVTTDAATIDAGTSNSCTSGLGYVSVWYKYDATSARKVYFDTFGTNYDTFIAVWTKNPDQSLTLVSCNNDASGTLQSALTLSTTNGVSYYIQVAQRNPNTTPSTAPGGTLQFHVKTFLDVAGNNPTWRFIEGIYAVNITGGCATSPDRLYCPTSNVTRAEMAIFLLKAKYGSAYTPPAVGASSGFADVPTSSPYAAWIKQLAAEGITGGCDAVPNYCPNLAVNRAQMSVFLLMAKGTPPAGPATGTVFNDVPASFWAAAWIEELASQGISGGCGGGNFCPNSNVTREQMAVFLSVAFSLTPLP